MEIAYRKSQLLVLLLVAPIASGHASATELPAVHRSPIRIVQTPQGYQFEENGEPVLFYQSRTKSLDGKLPRANYVHPLYDLDGNILTEDFPEDHLHQRGIYWAWHQVHVDGRAVADPWGCERTEWDVVDTEVLADDAGSTMLRLKVHWKCPLSEAPAIKEDDFRPIVEETVTIRVYPRTEQIRKIDFEIRLLALVDKLSIGGSEDEKGYGGFSARIKLPKGLQFTGRGGPITPQLGAIDVGPWVDFSAKFGGGEHVSGLAILCHRSLPVYPPGWVLRSKGSMQNPVYPGRTPVPLSRTEPTVLRYRLVVHRGGPEQLDLNKFQSAYDADPGYTDRTFESDLFGGPRNYRIFLPPDYELSSKRYPVIYYCHGHSDRYTLERYDDGKDTVPKIANFVAQHDVIVVAVDGYVKEHYDGFYGGPPWDSFEEGGDYDFGVYFQEMVAHVDATYRTLTSRRHRAISGLSMGGFTSLTLSARYPQLIGSTSAFNPSPELFTGDKGSRLLWQTKYHVACHSHTMVRFVRASGDYISQYHEQTRAAYSRAHEVDFEYRQDEYHRHWATSIGETFAFHMRAFDNTQLDKRPTRFSYASAYRSFDVWGYNVQVEGEGRGLVYLTDVRANGLRVTTRAWTPDGPAIDKKIKVRSASLYRPSETYHVSDFSFATGKTHWFEIKSDTQGQLVIPTDGSGHQFGFTGPSISPPQLVLLPVTTTDRLRLRPGKSLPLSLRIYNPADQPVRNVTVSISSDYPTVEWLDQSMAVAEQGSMTIKELGQGEVVDSGNSIQVRLVASTGYFAPTRLEITLSAEGQSDQHIPLDVLVVPERVPQPAEIKILDGRTATFSVFRQKGNQGGGKAISRTVTEGQGNGDGVLQPGEEGTLWVRIPQGLDPMDKNNWHRTKVYPESPWIVQIQDIQEQKQREWTGVKDRTSVIRLAKDVPIGTRIPLLLDNETWSFHYTPEVRYGHEVLYQAFQRHTHHLHQIELTVE